MTAFRRTGRALGTCALAAGIALGSAGPAAAQEDVWTPGPQFADDAESIEQVELTELFNRLEAGEISAQTYAAAAGSAESMRPVPVPTPPQQRTLRLKHKGQAKSYWCGPAAGAMIVDSIFGGPIKSKYNGAGFGQASFAGPAHMETERHGKTAWDSGLFARGVNRWIGANHYQQVDSPSVATMRGALRSSIGLGGRPVAADTVEFAGGKHYNGHPTNQTIGHWIVAFGYEDGGAKVKFADPSTTVWSGVSPKFKANTKYFTNTFLQSNGIAY